MGTILVPLFAHYRPAARLVQAAHAEGLRLIGLLYELYCAPHSDVEASPPKTRRKAK